jgi:hypothetical protein
MDRRSSLFRGREPWRRLPSPPPGQRQWHRACLRVTRGRGPDRGRSRTASATGVDALTGARTRRPSMERGAPIPDMKHLRCMTLRERFSPEYAASPGGSSSRTGSKVGHEAHWGDSTTASTRSSPTPGGSPRNSTCESAGPSNFEGGGVWPVHAAHSAPSPRSRAVRESAQPGLRALPGATRRDSSTVDPSERGEFVLPPATAAGPREAQVIATGWERERVSGHEDP